MTDTYYSLPQPYVQLLNNWHSEVKKCKVCSVTYIEAHNIGKWGCLQHFGEYDYDKKTRKYRWTCCNKLFNSKSFKPNGCIRSDHTQLDVPYTEINDIKIPTKLNQTIQLYKESLVDPNSGREYTVEKDMKAIRDIVRDSLQTNSQNELTIRRFDWKSFDHLMNNLSIGKFS